MAYHSFDNEQLPATTSLEGDDSNQHPKKSAQFKFGLQPVSTPLEAYKAARQGVYASLLIAGITFMMTLAFMLNTAPEELNTIGSLTSFIDVGISLLIAWGIHKMSRIAAVAGLCLHLISRVYVYQVTGVGLSGLTILVAGAITLCFINAIRGTFAYHRLKETA